jgi:hypothetical protein
MKLDTITMEKEAAEEALAEYRKAVKEIPHTKMNEARREYEQMDRAIIRGYREIAKGNQLLKLSEAILGGGVEQRTWNADYWQDGRMVRRNLTGTFPRMAACRADARHVCCSGIKSDGSVIFVANDRWSRRRADRLGFEGFGRPEYSNQTPHRAIVPTVPPTFRPPHNLGGYTLLWEAEWEQDRMQPPADPALLKQLAGDLYVVLAVWDLTELERAVLGGMRAE